jgi:Holliday junction resolvase RusA-like endonuclease
MAERLVIVIEYEAREDLDEFVDPLNEAMTQLRTWIDDHKQPHITPVQVYAAIKDDADRVLAVFES